MKNNWLPLALWAVFISLCSGTGNSILHKVEHQGPHLYALQSDEPLIVWRGDTRSPDNVRNIHRGFSPPNEIEHLTKQQAEDACSLYQHPYGGTRSFTKYVSSSTDPKVARLFASDFDDPANRGYIYEIQADEKFIDVKASLGKYGRYPEQVEQAASKPIGWDQVEGWYDLAEFLPHEMAILEDAASGPLKDMSQFVHRFHENPDWDLHKYYGRKGAGARPELAGFRKDSPAWDEEPWSQYKAKPVSKAWKDYTERVCASPVVTTSQGVGICPDDVLPQVEQEFTLADPLGARDLTGQLQSADPAQYKLDVSFTKASEAGEMIEADEAAQAAEAAEMAEAVADAAAIDAIELAELLEGETLVDIILAFLLL
ncbi:Heat-labile enterotoxin IIB, A chain [Metarhizium brunneum]|uniref:Heat-labile enterotoxin IIB, A chain n=1 Tax=Metarhizium brunneum TaxID=500148 RepID=A0A7D5UX92_9HYPO